MTTQPSKRRSTRRLTLVALIGVLMTVVLAAGGSPAAAEATPPDRMEDGQATVTRSTNGDLVVRLPSRLSVETAVAAPPPTTSPAPADRYFITSLNFSCDSRYVCAAVPYGNGWYIFEFLRYNTYNLSNWFGYGLVVNNQTDGAAARLLNYGGSQRYCVPAQHALTNVYWTPIWHIRLTASPC